MAPIDRSLELHLCPFPDGTLSDIWHLCNLDRIIAAMDLVLKQARVDPIETPFMKWGRP